MSIQPEPLFHPSVTPLNSLASLTSPSAHPSAGPPRGVPAHALQGTLALELTPRLEPPTPAPDDRPQAPPAGSDAVAIAWPRRHRIERWVQRYAQAAVEIVAGDRPASQLVRWSSPRVQNELDRRANAVATAGLHAPGLGRARRHRVRPVVKSLRLCFPTEETLEASVRVAHGTRSRAVAARFELIDGRWICCALEWG